jgi:pimeloyl-ACP methyl ester carboxylesterase
MEVEAWYRRLHETCSLDAIIALADLLLASDLTPRLGEIRVPALLLCPDGSPFIPLEVMVAMSKQFPKAELQVFAHAKHGLPLSHGTACAQVTGQFLERQFG